MSASVQQSTCGAGNSAYLFLRRRRAIFACAALALPALTAGCGPGGPISVALRPEVRRPERGVVLFICDGVSMDYVERGCAEGWLPNIRRRLLDAGTHVQNATTSLPTITYSSITTLLTGISPARHEIPANKWFDPRTRFFRNYGTIRDYRTINDDFQWPTIYARIRPLTSVSVQSPYTRGLTRNFANWMESGLLWYVGDFTAVDKMTATTVGEVADWANSQRRWPALLTLYFPGVDTVAHRNGSSAPRYRAAVENFDFQLGRVCDWLEKQGLLETTYLVFTSDHGHTDVRPGGRIDLVAFLRNECGLNATNEMFTDKSFAARAAFYDPFEIVVAGHGVRCAHLHIRSPAGWPEPPSYELVRCVMEGATAPDGQPTTRRLWEVPGIDIVAYAVSDATVRLRSSRGTARIETRTGAAGPEFRYVPDPDDVFGYLEQPALAAFVAAGFHDSRAWLAATAAAPYPDIVAQLPPLFRSPRFGQVLVFAAAGATFSNERSGHGGITRDEVCIPLMFAGPGIPRGATIEHGRAADLVPTLLELLDVEPPGEVEFDGRPLFRVPVTGPVCAE